MHYYDTYMKGLTKNPEEYHDTKGQPHVVVALKMKKDGKPVKTGDHIPYVICEGEPTQTFADRACHPDQVKHNVDIKIGNEIS